MRFLRTQLSQTLRFQDSKRLLLSQEETPLILRRIRHPWKHVVASFKVLHYSMTYSVTIPRPIASQYLDI